MHRAIPLSSSTRRNRRRAACISARKPTNSRCSCASPQPGGATPATGDRTPRSRSVAARRLRTRSRHAPMPGSPAPPASRCSRADHVLGRNADIRQEHFAEFRTAVGLPDRPHLHAGRPHIHDEVGDAAMFLRIRIGPGQQYAVVGVHRVRRPDLLPVDHVMIAVPHRPAAQRGKIGSRVRLRESLAPDFALRHACQIAALLRLGAVRQ